MENFIKNFKTQQQAKIKTLNIICIVKDIDILKLVTQKT